MAKKRVGRYPKAFKQMAVERLKRCENIVALSQEFWVSSATAVYVARSARSSREERGAASERA